MNFDIGTLKSGSDARGRALAAEGKEAVLTPEVAGAIARAFLEYARERRGVKIGRVAVGHDSRLTAETLKAGVFRALAGCGAVLLDCGLTTTPAMFMTTRFPETDCDAAIMITASHMPKDMNGLKFFLRDGGLEGKEVERILSLAQNSAQCTVHSPQLNGSAQCTVHSPQLKDGSNAQLKDEILHIKQNDRESIRNDDKKSKSEIVHCALCIVNCNDDKKNKSETVDCGLCTVDCFKVVQTSGLGLYRAFLKNKFKTETGMEKPLAGRKIAVDAGNGAGGFYAELLAELGADTSGSRYLEPDGDFPNHIPNPEDENAARAAREMVRQSGAEIGVIFDTDVDRAGLVGRRGDINRSALIALCAKFLAADYPGCTVVTDSVTNRSLTPYIESLGCRHHRFKRGYKNVIDEARRLRREGVNAVLAIETSGHAAFFDNSFLDDGAYLVSYCLIRAAKSGKGFDELIADFKPPTEEKELRVPIAARDFRAAGAEMLERIEGEARARGWERIEGYEGVRFVAGDTCLTARMSVHDPILVLNYESEREGGCQAMGGVIERVLGEGKGSGK
ncbi:MAG: hypothetical protein LBL66_00900 [Clostridiales bacterium]|nr:hypothetical protein [Clostridiales bacterium]